jgi:hypothetical protein
MPENNNNNDSNQIIVGNSLLVNQTPTAKEVFKRAVTEYAERLKLEAQNIEHMEHTGNGPPEITGAHVEEAKYVSIRRMRLRALSKRKTIPLRLGQIAMTAAAGVGASNISDLWGSGLCVGGIVVGLVLFVVENNINREF